MDRRRFSQQLAWTFLATSPLLSCAATSAGPAAGRWIEIEQAAQGRLGVAVLDTATGGMTGHRLDERFPMCSTFKWLAAAFVLHRVDQGVERLDCRIRFGREVLLPHSPVTERHAGGEGMTLAALCEATVTVSDNAAGNLVLRSFGGPQALTGYARSLGDAVTRLDRWEPDLNESDPADPRDTTTPRAMALLLQATVLGDALSPASRATLVRWLEATSTNGERLKKGLPPGWRLGSKTGTGERGSTNDVGVFWPPGRAAIVVAAYLTESRAMAPVRNAAIAAVARQVVGLQR